MIDKRPSVRLAEQHYIIIVQTALLFEYWHAFLKFCLASGPLWLIAFVLLANHGRGRKYFSKQYSEYGRKTRAMIWQR